jgi:diguanylate cyclase (GGDEF)-like protein/PAS domain S-box-containing protein
MLNQILSPVARVAFGLVGLSVSVVFLASFCGIFPDRRAEQVEGREIICESVAMSFSSMANRIDTLAMQDHFSAVIKRYPEIKTIGLRKSDGEHLLEIGDHFSTWSLKENEQSNSDEIFIPIYGAEQELWGTVEVQFVDLGMDGFIGMLKRPEYSLAGMFALFGFTAFYFYLRFVLRQLNPSRVVPNRVREALDTLAEGLVVMDKRERIVLANKAIQTSTGQSVESLIGKKASELPFAAANTSAELPWQTALERGKSVRGKLMRGVNAVEKQSTFMVSSAPIVDDKGANRGAIVSFEDVSKLQRKTIELEQMFSELDASTKEIKRQNRELEFLATRDSLTGCLNRRSFFNIFDEWFAVSKSNGSPLSAFMVDIDHFKSINDNHGHAVGDEVLRQIAATLESSVRPDDVVSRYGGEEFSVLLPNTDIDTAFVVAENIRSELEKLKPDGLNVTTSLGLSAVSENPSSPQELLEQADKCLYAAKRNGRNQVVRWDNLPDEPEGDQTIVTELDQNESELNGRIPFHAVTALISALAYRDQETANHCRRVADLCVAVAEGLLSMKECYTLEIAGLLHDIGKIGVPDSILLKPGAFSDEEWRVMRRHERNGIDLVQSTFCCDALHEIVANCRITYAQQCDGNQRVSTGAKILMIVDAYDSMTTDKPYRKGLSQNDAFAELRLYAGQQFDPQLVERAIATLKVRGDDLTTSPQKVSKSAALNIGLQIERLAEAVDDRDQVGIGAIAHRLGETAAKHGVEAVAKKANEISVEMDEECELYDLIRCTNELMDLCRSTQRALVDC